MHSSIYDEFLRRFVAEAEKLVPGDAFDPATRFSSLAGKRLREGGHLHRRLPRGRGRFHTGGVADDGSWVVRPTIVDNLPLDSAPYCEEIFGLSRAHRVASRLRAGTVWVNCFFIRDLRTPFGGVGDSGVGREGGNFSREFFTEPKAVVMQINR